MEFIVNTKYVCQYYIYWIMFYIHELYFKLLPYSGLIPSHNLVQKLQSLPAEKICKWTLAAMHNIEILHLEVE
jgi:hypothetical protein